MHEQNAKICYNNCRIWEAQITSIQVTKIATLERKQTTCGLNWCFPQGIPIFDTMWKSTRFMLLLFVLK